MQQHAQLLLLKPGQGRQKRPDGGKAALQKVFADSMATRAEIKRDRPPVTPLTTLDKAIGDQPVDEAHGSRMRQAQDTPQLIVGRAGAVPDDHEGGRRLPCTTENVACRLFNAVRDVEPDDAEQICGPVSHAGRICAPRTIFNLTLCVVRT